MKIYSRAGPRWCASGSADPVDLPNRALMVGISSWIRSAKSHTARWGCVYYVEVLMWDTLCKHNQGKRGSAFPPADWPGLTQKLVFSIFSFALPCALYCGFNQFLTTFPSFKISREFLNRFWFGFFSSIDNKIIYNRFFSFFARTSTGGDIQHQIFDTFWGA